MRRAKRAQNSVVLAIILAIALSACTPSGPRIGAICRDGWRSQATGSGACSHHGGVDHWLYANP